jgi:acetate CoA/acetoacetate CoA-transferase alpha subunit
MRRAISADDAALLVPDGASLMFGGFMGVGTPERIIDALVERGVRGLTIIGNATGATLLIDGDIPEMKI